MQERFDALGLACVLALAACGGIDDGSALIRSPEVLSCQTDTDCHEGYVCAHFSARSYCERTGTSTTAATPAPALAPSSESDRSLADPCADGACTQGESEQEQSHAYVSQGQEGPLQQSADAGVSSDAGREDCRYGGEDCARAACGDASVDRDCREDGHDDGGEEDSEERSGPNRGQH